MMRALISILLAAVPFAANAAPSAQLAAEIENSYDPKIESRKIGSDWSLYGCAIEEIQLTGQDPVTLKQRTVDMNLYRARGSRNAVILLPPTGGVNLLDRGYANELCASGISVALVAGWEHQADTSLDFSMHNHGALRALAASRHVVEFLRSRDFQSIGMLGTSIGAIAGALAFGIEPRISAVALIVGSAHFADVIAESDETGAAALRNQRMRAFGFKNEAEYKREIRKAVYIEPSAFLNNIGGRKSLVVSADADTTVPSRYQLDLAQQLQASPHLRLHGNHLRVIKDTFFKHRAEIRNFFLKAWAAR